VSVNNKNVEIDPVVLPTEASTYLSCRHVHPNLVQHIRSLMNTFTRLPKTNTLIDNNKAFSYYLVGRYIIEDVPKEAAE